MISRAFKTFARNLGIALGSVGFIVVCPCFFCLILFRGGGGKCGTNRRRSASNADGFIRSKSPSPRFSSLPPHVDLRRAKRPLATQAEACSFFNLPFEIREMIYEELFSRRLIFLRHKLTDSPEGRCAVIKSWSCLPDDPLAHMPIGALLESPVSRVSTGLLLSCRQTYFEGLPILHRTNTFHIWASQLDEVVRCGLGEYCLPDIRSVYIDLDVDVWPGADTSVCWLTVFVILRKMGLQQVAFDMDGRTELGAYLDTDWGRRSLALGNLKRLEFWFRVGSHLLDTEGRDARDKYLDELREVITAPTDGKHAKKK
ncbi:hypothetical protein R3P38DRAFT_1201056 [Favolaschia claudopus]|uniref:DUF7730 domain-containing protein n=1 Tax=Favolaschia claudopus TaxID=2862362 RepID=A0AAW0B2V6_9AGAR